MIKLRYIRAKKEWDIPVFRRYQIDRTERHKYVDLSPGSKISGVPQYMFQNIIVDYPKKRGKNTLSLYLGHPDSVLLDTGHILVAYPKGHCTGETVLKESPDGGKTWSLPFGGLPESFRHTIETPTLYKLDFRNGEQKLILINGRPDRGKALPGDGFDVSLSVSKDKKTGFCDGKVWSFHENIFGSQAIREEYRAPKGEWPAFVAMASLTRLKEKGVFADKWMGLFHMESPFRLYKTILTFDINGQTQWTKPQRLLPEAYWKKESALCFCEPEVVRSPDGKELALLIRTNAKKSFSQVCFSTDEGLTWTPPQDLSRELTGERHKAEYDRLSGKLVITFRDVDWYKGHDFDPRYSFSRGWVAWVGEYSDLHKGAMGSGGFTILLSRTYNLFFPIRRGEANADTGYAGLTIDSKGHIVAISYGRFSRRIAHTYIIAKRFTVSAAARALPGNRPLR
jgi:hypothetical protein